MVVDLIGIFELKGPYCTLMMTDWVLQALSVISRGSWGDVARCFTIIQWINRSDLIVDRDYDEATTMDLKQMFTGPRPNPGPLTWVKPVRPELSVPPLLFSKKPPPPPPARLCRKIVSGQFDEENPFVLILSVLLVQADEGVSFLVVDLIGDFYRNLPRRADDIVTTVGARNKCQQAGGRIRIPNSGIRASVFRI
ncbi:digalactosyldiacylglycerol synthase 1, chloroplastic-like [Dorcoceras hygrometricum]|uniref:Digalactosyldiacylglycerol synthase 1, chloroplastic-like n=1 Tax=Dorcoceras hygrometricum TaxID=472368 RepID=A0A2Z7BLZ3_9LAMI|nr:digalactosyldiacylglycerol synthase 1, chloroplastic-like [Dorcoceras hygrometricum]